MYDLRRLKQIRGLIFSYGIHTLQTYKEIRENVISLCVTENVINY